MSRARCYASLLVSGLLLSAAALAQSAYTVREANVRAGPERDYPVVTRLAAGTPVEVTGCNEDWSWCEVIAEPDRGWVYAGSLEYPYEGRRVVILRHGYIGLPIVPFVVGSYWDTYYRGRPWYGRRTYWVNRAPTFHRPAVVGRPYVGHPTGSRPPAVRPQVARPPTGRLPQPRHVHVEAERAKPQPQRPQPQRPHDKPHSGHDKN
jgi:uncharacterized protein YraI